MNKWVWVALTILFFQINDIILRLFSVNTNFVAGATMQAIPLVVGSGVLIYKNPKLRKFEISKTSLKFIVLYGSLQFLMGNMLYFTSMKYGGLSIATPTVQSQAIWALFIGLFFLKEKITPTMWFGISMFAIGIVGLAFFKSVGTQMQNSWELGVAAGLLGGLCWASASATQRKLLNIDTELLHILFLATIVGIALLVVFGFAVMGGDFASEFTRLDTYKMLIVGISFGAAVWCIAQALKRIPISKVIPVLSINIIFNTLIGYIFFNEFISLGTFMSMLTAFFGILIVNEPIKALRASSNKKNQ